MKVVGLINRIYEGTQPKHIRFDTEEWFWGYDSYVPKNFLNSSPDVQTSVSLFQRYRIDYCLYDEVEVLEDEEDEDIPFIPDDELYSVFDDKERINKNKRIDYNFKVLKEKINQVVEELNRRNNG